MKLSRIDFIGLNGNDGLHYEEEAVMSMTRKDFEAIANIIKEFKQNIDPHLLTINTYINMMVRDLSNYFKQSNSSFDKERFIKACGYKEP